MTNACRLGVIGLGTMGRNLLLNMADSGFKVVGFDKDPKQVQALREESKWDTVIAADKLEDFVEVLDEIKIALLLVPAGKIVDYVIEDLLPYFGAGDIIIDGGNSFFKDTQRRQKALAEKQIHFIGLGISGGAEGARLGPSMMPGGDAQAYEAFSDILEKVAADHKGEPCIRYLGQGAVGHYVKMVHNGIEYGLMQLIAESYALMKDGLQLENAAIGKYFLDWNTKRLRSYLVEITGHIFHQKDDLTDADLIDMILDSSKSKGTGKWTSQDAMDIQAPVPVIDMAVVARDLSRDKAQRKKANSLLSDIAIQDEHLFVDPRHIANALYFSYVVSYAQGLAQLTKASEEYGFQLSMVDVVKIWRAGCIIRADLLDDFANYFAANDLDHLLMEPSLLNELNTLRQDVVKVIQLGMQSRVALPCLMAALSYFDSFTSDRLPANLIQAQRDFFGSHTYERIDREGIFHTEWNK